MATEFLNSEGRANELAAPQPSKGFAYPTNEDQDEFDLIVDEIPLPEPMFEAPIAYPQRDNIEVGLNSDNSLVILKWGPVMTAGITAGQARKLAHLLHNCASQVRGRR